MRNPADIPPGLSHYGPEMKISEQSPKNFFNSINFIRCDGVGGLMAVASALHAEDRGFNPKSLFLYFVVVSLTSSALNLSQSNYSFIAFVRTKNEKKSYFVMILR